MANYKTNEESLLTYLEELKSQTQNLITSESHTMWYWKSANYIKDVKAGNIIHPTNGQVDFFITNCENRLKPLRFRLMWLESQINEITNLKSVA